MKILILSHRVPWPLNEGGTIAIFNHLKGYAQAGCEVTVLALNAKKHNIDTEEATKAISEYATVHLFPINTDVRPLPAFLNLFSGKSYNVARFYNRQFDTILEDHLKRNSYDFIQVEGTFAAPYSRTVLKNRSGIVFMRQHNVEWQIWKRMAANESNPVKRGYLRMLARRLYRFEKEHLNLFDAIVPITEDDANRFREMGCSKPIFVSPAGIDTEVWHPTYDRESGTRAYHMGSLTWVPNVKAVKWFLDEIWPLVTAIDTNLTFHLAGKGMPTNLSELEHHGFVADGEVKDGPDYVADKSICVVPLKSGSGIRVKILEAMSAGKAVVATTIGAQGIECTHGRDIIIADDESEFAQAIVKLANDQAYRRQIQENARALILEKYSNLSVVEQLLNFFRTFKP